MKKFAKVISITALVLAVVGLMLTLIGVFGGGAKIVRTLAENGKLSIGPEDFELVEFIDGISIVVENDSTVVFNDDFEVFIAGNLEFTYSEAEVENFVFSMAGGEIDIKQGAGDDWTIEIDGVGKFQTYVENGTLYVVGNQKGVNMDLGDVTITVPRGETLGNVEIHLGAGDMSIAYLAADEMEVAVGAGELWMDEVDVNSLEISVGAGEIEIQDGTMGDVEVSVGMGAAYITGTISGNINGGVSMGELCVEVHGSTEKEHNYNVSCAAGEVQIDGKTYAGVGNTMNLDNDAETTYNLDCAMGRIEVTFR